MTTTTDFQIMIAVPSFAAEAFGQVCRGAECSSTDFDGDSQFWVILDREGMAKITLNPKRGFLRKRRVSPTAIVVRSTLLPRALLD